MDGKLHVACFVHENDFVLCGCIVEELFSFFIVCGVGAACLAAKELSAGSIVGSIALA